jgi:hypothetical protein
MSGTMAPYTQRHPGPSATAAASAGPTSPGHDPHRRDGGEHPSPQLQRVAAGHHHELEGGERTTSEALDEPGHGHGHHVPGDDGEEQADGEQCDRAEEGDDHAEAVRQPSGPRCRQHARHERRGDGRAVPGDPAEVVEHRRHRGGRPDQVERAEGHQQADAGGERTETATEQVAGARRTGAVGGDRVAHGRHAGALRSSLGVGWVSRT